MDQIVKMPCIHRFSLSILFTLTAFYTLGQSAPDFFFPGNGKNKSVFFTATSATDKTISQTHLYLIKHKDAKIELVWDEMMSGKTIYIDTKYLIVLENEIKMERETHFNGVTSNIYKDYSPAQVIFKLPIGDQKSNWRYVGPSGDMYECTSYNAKVRVNGELKKAVKVDKVVRYKSGKIVDWASTTEYYVLGVGLLKIVQTKSKEVYKFLDSQGFDSSQSDK